METLQHITAAMPRMRTFWFYRSDGSLCGRSGSTDPRFEHQARREAAKRGEGVIEHAGDLDLQHDRVDVATGKLIDPLDYAFAADLERKWQYVLRQFPTLANPAPPVPPADAEGEQRFSVREFWADFAERAARGEWKLRAPTDDVDQLAGPILGHGACLEPVFGERHIDWYDPKLPAQDEDIVLVKLDPLECQRIHERGRSNPEWVAMYASPNPLCVKLLTEFAGEYWLVTNDSMFRLGKNQILGVLRRSLVNGEPAYVVPRIFPNAATQPYAARDDGPDSFNPSANGDGYLTISGSGIDGASLLNGSLVIDAKVADPVSTLANISLGVTWSGGSEFTASMQPQHTDFRSYTFTHSFTTLPADTAWTMKVGMSGNANCTVQRAQMRAEVLKR